MKEKLRRNKKKILAGLLIVGEAVVIGALSYKLKKSVESNNILRGEKRNLEDMNNGLTREVKNLAYQLGKKS